MISSLAKQGGRRYGQMRGVPALAMSLRSIGEGIPAVVVIAEPTGIGVNTLATCNLIGQRRRSTWNTYADMAASIEEAL